jgi:ferric-dicitrate binding protein FerR (iron transport regulator)
VARLAVPPVPALDLEGVPVLLGPATLHTGASEVKRVRLKGGAIIGVAAETTLNVDAGQRPSIARGRIDLEVPHQPPGEQFTVEAGPYMIVVVGTKFGVALGSRQVEVSVTEGVVEVWRDGKVVRLTAGRSFQGPLAPTSMLRSAARLTQRKRPPRVALAPTRHPSDKFDQAKLALATGDAVAGLDILRELALGTGPIAENSGYEVGVVLRDRLDQPREAIAAWKAYRERFPRGLLRAEADLSIVETHLELGERQPARAEAEAFMRRYPRSERRSELAALVRRLDLELGGGGAGRVVEDKPHPLGAIGAPEKLIEAGAVTSAP